MAIGVQSTHGACERDGHGERYPLLPSLPSPEDGSGEDFQATELLGVSRAFASGVIYGCADIIDSYDILSGHQVPHWKPVVPTFTLLFTFMHLTSFPVL